jgi:cell division transport system permease protein
MILLKRILKAGLQGFYRNRTVSISSILILTITLSIITSVFFFRAVFNYTIGEVKNKVDIRLYLKNDITEASTNEIQTILQSLPETKNLSFVSRDEALAIFKEKNAGNQSSLDALTNIGTNPFPASIIVQAKDSTMYESIINKINNENILGANKDSVEKINYLDLKDSIDRLNNIVSWVTSAGYAISMIFIIMSIMIVYNTVRLAIFVFKEEINVMKLVGASDMYIRGPFIVEASLYGILAAVISTALAYPATLWIARHTVNFFEGLNLFSYYKANFFELFFMLCLFGIMISIISSILAVRKYLKI